MDDILSKVYSDLFTIQNVPIKLKGDYEIISWILDLQYKMFLLNYN